MLTPAAAGSTQLDRSLWANPWVLYEASDNKLSADEITPTITTMSLWRKRGGEFPIHHACRVGHLPAVQALLTGVTRNGKKICTPIDLRSEDQSTGLHLAAEFGHSDVITFLLAAGADPDLQDRGKQTPLLIAISANKLQAVKALLNGSRPNGEKISSKIDERYGNDQLTALHASLTPFCFYSEIPIALLEAGADPNVKTNKGATPLYLACKIGDLKIVKTLINGVMHNGEKRTARINELCKSGRTALHAAAKRGATDIILALFEAGAEPNAKTADGFSPLCVACSKGQLNAVHVLVNRLTRDGNTIRADLDERCGPKQWTALHVAAGRCYRQIVQLLVDAGADPTAITLDNQTPLALACQQPKEHMVHPFHQNRLQVVDILIQAVLRKLEPQSLLTLMNQRCRLDQATPLHLAAENDQDGKVVQLLLEYGADSELKTTKEETAFDVACRVGYLPSALALINFKSSTFVPKRLFVFLRTRDG